MPSLGSENPEPLAPVDYHRDWIKGVKSGIFATGKGYKQVRRRMNRWR